GAPRRIHVLARNSLTGALSEVQCIAEFPAPTGCSTGRVLGQSQSLVLSPDGLHAYSTDFVDQAVSIFDRDPSTGLLTQKAGTAGCVSDSGTDNLGSSTCATG